MPDSFFCIRKHVLVKLYCTYQEILMVLTVNIPIQSSIRSSNSNLRCQEKPFDGLVNRLSATYAWWIRDWSSSHSMLNTCTTCQKYSEAISTIMHNLCLKSIKGAACISQKSSIPRFINYQWLFFFKEKKSIHPNSSWKKGRVTGNPGTSPMSNSTGGKTLWAQHWHQQLFLVPWIGGRWYIITQ